jgi:hypothetical protein
MQTYIETIFKELCIIDDMSHAIIAFIELRTELIISKQDQLILYTFHSSSYHCTE